MAVVTLITATPRVVATGAPTTVRLAGGGGRVGYYHKGEHWRAGVAEIPRFKAEVQFDEGGWTGGVVPTTAAVVFAPTRSGDLSELAALFWTGAPIVVEDGEETGTSFATRLTGAVREAAVTNGRLVLTIADLGAALDKPLLIARFAGTGGVEGGPEAAGALKRRSFGRVFNVEGRVRDKANNIFEFGDPAFPLASFDVVRDKGRDGFRADLAWQGSAAATNAALAAAVAPQGGGVFAPSIASVKWWTQPAGPLTANIRGEIGAAYVETVPELAARVLASAGGPAIANVSAMSALRAGEAGIHAGSESDTVASLLDRLLLGVSLLWVLEPAGAIRLRELGWGVSAGSLRAGTVSRLRTLPPVRSRRVGYRKSHRVHADGDIAAVLLQSDPDAAAKLAGIAAGATRNVPRGPWAAGVAYAEGDVFQFGGTSYWVVVPHLASGSAPDYTKTILLSAAGAQGTQGTQGATGAAGAAGAQGPVGTAGASLYTWTAYASNATGTANFTTGVPSAVHTHIGIANNQASAVEGNDAAAYTWSLFKGADGAQGTQGVPGTPGANGAPTFTWFAYADSPDGTVNFTGGEPGGRRYLGLAANKSTAVESTNPADYFWSLIKGADGAQGIQGATGAAGAAGAQGPAGAAGASLYTWTAYATNATGTTGFTTGVPNDSHTYIGIANNQASAVEGIDPAAYTWSLFKGANGAQGTQGVPGTPGPSGAPTFTWFAYADSPDGTVNFTNGEGGSRRYLGLAANKPTAIESANPADYFWSLVNLTAAEAAKLATVQPGATSGINKVPNSNGLNGTTDGWAIFQPENSSGAEFTLLAGGGFMLRKTNDNLASVAAAWTTAIPVTPGKKYRLRVRTGSNDDRPKGFYLRIQQGTGIDAAGFLTGYANNTTSFDAVADAAQVGSVQREYIYTAPAGIAAISVCPLSAPGGSIRLYLFDVEWIELTDFAKDVVGAEKPEANATKGATVGVDTKKPGGGFYAVEELQNDSLVLNAIEAGITDEPEFSISRGAVLIAKKALPKAVQNASAGLGQNQQVNSDLNRGTFGYQPGYSSYTTTMLLHNLYVSSTEQYFGERNVLISRTPPGIANPTGGIFDIRALPENRGSIPELLPIFGLPVKKGDRVFARVYAGSHRCNTALLILAWDRFGNYLGETQFNGGKVWDASARPAPGQNGDLANFGLISGLWTIPFASASYACLHLRGIATGEADPFAFWTEPAIGKVPSGQNVVPVYSPGPSDRLADETAKQTIVSKLNPLTGKPVSSLFFHTAAAAGFKKTTTARPTATLAADGTATINVPAHTQSIPGATAKESRSYAAATIPGKAANTYYTLYLIDPLFEGGARTIYATTDPDDANQASALSVGNVLTPTAGGTTSTGEGGTYSTDGGRNRTELQAM